MDEIFLYNTLTRKKEVFLPLLKNKVGLYTCGPTVYNYAHIGNLRTFLFEDFLKRTLLYNDYNVLHVTNITDVGHLTGDMDMGEDKMEKGARREGKSAWEIADYYTKAIQADLIKLNIIAPNIWCKATDNIPEQIEMVKTLEEKGYTYQISDGIYFDTSKIKDYNKLSHLPLEELKEGARVEVNNEKINPTDFALWKFSKAGEKRQMEWDSPWGVGFPGWHIECSAMSLKYLDPNLDIHCGGIDHINIHHTNEIAQSEAATGKKFFNYWLHGEFLNVREGDKMSKSTNNFLTLDRATEENDVSPLAYRLAACQVHYRKSMEYSGKSLKQAENALQNYRQQIQSLGNEITIVDENFKLEFKKAINNDLNIPQALAILSKLLKSNLSKGVKLATALDFDKVLGLDLDKKEDVITLVKVYGKEIDDRIIPLSNELKELLENREKARLQSDWKLSDELRSQLEALGFLVEDINNAQKLTLKKTEHED